jgi:hypothetical protein
MGAGLWVGAATSLLLGIVFLVRFRRTGRFMPAGGLLIVSAVALALLVHAARGAA